MQKQLGRSLSKADKVILVILALKTYHFYCNKFHTKESYRPLYDRYHRLKDALGGKKSVFVFSGMSLSSFVCPKQPYRFTVQVPNRLLFLLTLLLQLRAKTATQVRVERSKPAKVLVLWFP